MKSSDTEPDQHPSDKAEDAREARAVRLRKQIERLREEADNSTPSQQSEGPRSFVERKMSEESSKRQ
jgi:hypothetical protein